MLSTINRIADYCSLDVGNGRVDGVDADTESQRKNRRSIIQWGNSISDDIEDYISRKLIIQQRTEYVNVLGSNRSLFNLKAYPIVSIASVAYDVNGLYTGDEVVLPTDQYFVSAYDNLCLRYPIYEAFKGLRVVYTGGCAYNAVNSTYTVVLTGTITDQTYYVYGATSEAYGKVKSYSAGSLVIEQVQGVFVAGEALTFQTTLYGNDISGKSATITTVDQPSLIDLYPGVEQALLVEVRYMNKHQLDFENQSSAGGGTTRRTTEQVNNYTFQTESLRYLNSLINVVIA